MEKTIMTRPFFHYLVAGALLPLANPYPVVATEILASNADACFQMQQQLDKAQRDIKTLQIALAAAQERAEAQLAEHEAYKKEHPDMPRRGF